MTEKHCTWNDFEALTDKIIDEIKKSEKLKERLSKKYDWVISINRGGLVPGVMLSHKLGAEHGVLSVSSYEGRKNRRQKVKRDLYISQIEFIKSHQNILIVDDISRSGETLDIARATSKKFDPDISHIDTATIHYVTGSKTKPTYYGEEVETEMWIDYPWEQHGSKLVVVKNELQEQITAVG